MNDATAPTASREWVFALLLFLATLLAYERALTGQAIWDDDRHLTAANLRSSHGLEKIWFEPGATEQYYPLVHSVFWVEDKLWGQATLGYHLVNIILHVLGAVLLVKILRTLEIPGAWLAAAVFALHPVQVESVAWMTEMKNTLSGVFYFGSVLAYLRFDRSRSKGAYLCAFALFTLGMLSKTAILTLPAALLVLFWWKRGKLSAKLDVLPLVPFFVVGAALGFLTSWVELHVANAGGSEFHFSLLERCLIAGRAVWFYLGKVIWPVDLIFSYPRWTVNPAVWWQYLFPLTFLVLIGALWARRKRGRGPLAAALFFVGTLFPTLGFFNVYAFRYSFVADHWQYLACLGPIVLLTAVAARGGRAFAGALVLVLGILTWRQCGMYANAETVWHVTLERNPACWMGHNNLGAILLVKGRLDEAINEYQKALALEPGSPNAENNLGKAFIQKGWTAQAIPHLQVALEREPDNAEICNNLGYALLHEGKVDEAIPQIRKALALRPIFPEARFNLADILLKKGSDPQRLNTLAWSMATSPNPGLRGGRQAVRLASRAVEMTGATDPDSVDTLAAAYAETGQFAKAVETAGKALKLARPTGNQAMISDMEKRLQLYEKSQPFRESP